MNTHIQKFNTNWKSSKELTEEERRDSRELTRSTLQQQRPKAEEHFIATLDSIFSDPEVHYLFARDTQTRKLAGFLMYKHLDNAVLYVKGLLTAPEYDKCALARWLLETVKHFFQDFHLFCFVRTDHPNPNLFVESGMTETSQFFNVIPNKNSPEWKCYEWKKTCVISCN